MRNAYATFLVFCLISNANAAFVRVDPAGTGDALTVQMAMGMAAAGDTIAVIQGAHNANSVEMTDGVQLLGGWNAAFSVRAPGTSLIHCGAQGLRCTSGQGLSTIIDGFEFTGASNSAILCTSSSPTITRNEFHGNTGADGAAVHCEFGASPLIEDNHIHNNSASYGGGIRGHWGSDTSPTIRGNLIEFNSAGSGGGIGVNNGSPLIENNIVRNNFSGGTGGGIHVWHGEGGVVTIRDNLIVDNSSRDGGGIGINGGHPIIEHNTLWGNSASRWGGAISQATSKFPDPGVSFIHHNILGGSPDGHGVYCINDSSMTLSCNCLFGNAEGVYANCPPPDNDIYQDPQFCDIASADFGLRSSSPCAAPGPTGCGLIGARPVACGPVSIEATSWSRIKAAYRQ
ncbi:MAG: hypothetical protein DHS20C21_02270 [Gemmatimonadota bacterium]|nr:MAG: hypothetical protein DHS20C21_02270 [Gemmatimonadota bacterium]